MRRRNLERGILTIRTDERMEHILTATIRHLDKLTPGIVHNDTEAIRYLLEAGFRATVEPDGDANA